jgi:hypothetical protein
MDRARARAALGLDANQQTNTVSLMHGIHPEPPDAARPTRSHLPRLDNRAVSERAARQTRTYWSVGGPIAPSA